jgi:agmatinase
MARSILRPVSPDEADVVLIEANYDRTSSFGKGADHGPRAVLDCLETQLEVYDRTSGTRPAERLGIARVDPGDLNGLDPEAMVAALRKVYASHAGRFRVMVGGEHSISNAAWLELAGQAAETTIVQVDAHADLRDDDADYSEEPFGRYAHSAVMRRAHELGFALVQVGVRAYSEEERRLFDDPRITVFEWGPDEPPVERIVAAIRTEKVYLTLDVDGLDPAVMPATGTPVPGGLSWHYTVDLLRAVARGHRVVGADLVEVAPRAGDALTEYGAAQLIYSLLGLALCRSAVR